MKKFIGYLLTTILAVSVFTGCSNSTEENNRLDDILEKGKITVATSPDYAPYEFIDLTKSGQDAIVGSDMEFAKYIAESLGVELEIEQMSFDVCLSSVQEGKVDLVISGLAYKEDRAKAMQLSDHYNKSGYQGIMVLTEELDQYQTAEDFSGKVIGAQNASLQYENVVNQLPDAQVEAVTTISDGIMMLRSGKIDCLAMSGSAGGQYASNYDDIAMSDFQFESNSEGTVVGIRNGEEALYNKINEIIAEVNEKGLYEGWLEEATALSQSLS